jgi:hypothetical protein
MFAKFLSFDEMVTPLIIKIIYWICIVCSVLGGLIKVLTGLGSRYGSGGAVLSGLLIIVIGPIIARIWCELLIVLFEIHKNLVDLNKKIVIPEAPAQEQQL